MTDANLILGRLIPDYFPKIFGKSEKEPLDVEASRSAFEKLAKEINDSHEETQLGLDEIVYGCVLSWCSLVQRRLYLGQVHQGRERDYVQAYTSID